MTKYTGPEAYTSRFCARVHFLVRTLADGQEVWAIVVNNEQPYQGVLFPTLKDARTYLRDNGFVLHRRCFA